MSPTFSEYIDAWRFGNRDGRSFEVVRTNGYYTVWFPE